MYDLKLIGWYRLPHSMDYRPPSNKKGTPVRVWGIPLLLALVISGVLIAWLVIQPQEMGRTPQAPALVKNTPVRGTNSGNIKIVSSLPRTGLSKTQTDDIVAGIRMALEEHGGKAGGFAIAYEDWDDATAQAGKWDAATEAANAAKAASDPNVMVYLGTFNSGAAKISIPILNKAGLAMISPSNTAPELTKPGFDDATLSFLYDTSKPRNYFRVLPADDVQGVAAANWAIELGFKKVYIVNDQETYGKAVANRFEKQFMSNGGLVVTNEGIELGQSDYKVLVNKVKDSGADLLYFGGLVDDGGAQIAHDLKAIAPNVQFMGPDGIVTQTFIDAAGVEATEGMFGTLNGRLSTINGWQLKDLPAKGAKFYENFKAKMGHDPDPYAICGYEAANVALDAINRAGTKDRADILKAISGTKNYEGALGTWSFDANGDTTLSDVSAFKVKGGKWEFQKYLIAGSSTEVSTPAVVSATSTVPTSEAMRTPSVVSTQAVSGDKSVIKIVSSLPRTGASKYQTDDIVEGMRMALEEHGGKAGSFSIIYEDWDDATAELGKWDPAMEAGNAVRAVDDPNIMVYLGTFNSGAAKVSIPMLNKASLAMISPANTAPELTKLGFDDFTHNSLYPTGKRNYFRVTTADDVQAVAEANWATELGFKRAYVLNDDETYGKGTAMVFEKQFKANGGTVIANQTIDYKQPEFTALMSTVKDSGADLVYFGGLIETGGPQLLKDLRAVAPNIAFMGPDGIEVEYFVDVAGADVAEGTLASIAGRGYQDLPPKGVRFFNNFKARMGREPDTYAVYGYEAMNIALDAIARAGKKDRVAILNAISTTRNYDGAFGVRSFDANGDVTPNDIGLYKVQGGKWVFQKYMTVP
jgi:branched-chain amino acid transport system substrate-binding protein